jgi:hypothetical protein
VGRCVKGSAKGIAHGFEDVAAVGLNGGAEESVVAGQRLLHRFEVLLPEAGAAFDVGEQEGDRRARRIYHVETSSGV